MATSSDDLIGINAPNRQDTIKLSMDVQNGNIVACFVPAEYLTR
jgi:hypothetical protein